jgi:hypothetical protein
MEEFVNAVPYKPGHEDKEQDGDERKDEGLGGNPTDTLGTRPCAEPSLTTDQCS